MLTGPLTRRSLVGRCGRSVGAVAPDWRDPVRPRAGDAVWLVPEKTSPGGSVVATESSRAGVLTKKTPYQYDGGNCIKKLHGY